MKNAIDGATDKKLSTRQLLDKIPNVPCLYRHRVTGRYYAIKSIRGKLKTEALRTDHGESISDRKLAERRLREWVEDTETPASNSAGGPMTLDALASKYRETKSGLSKKSRDNVEWTITNMKAEWHRGMQIQIREIKPSDIDVFLAKFYSDWTGSTYNTFTMFLRQMFELAVKDRIIKTNPVAESSKPRKPIKKEKRPTPTDEQFNSIVATIRNQRFTDHSEDSADLASFLGLAALGEAEADTLHWRDLDLSKPGFTVCRQKTDRTFTVPFYPKLRVFLSDLRERQNRPGNAEKVFRVKSCKKALISACKTLGYTAYSPRALRRCGIITMLHAKVSIKLVSKWQGHSDGGKLILDTYSEIINEAEDRFEAMELAKLG